MNTPGFEKLNTALVLGIYNFAFNRPTKLGRPRLRVTKPAKSLPEAKKLVAFSRTWVGKKKILKHQITKKIQIHPQRRRSGFLAKIKRRMKKKKMGLR